MEHPVEQAGAGGSRVGRRLPNPTLHHPKSSLGSAQSRVGLGKFYKEQGFQRFYLFGTTCTLTQNHMSIILNLA